MRNYEPVMAVDGEPLGSVVRNVRVSPDVRKVFPWLMLAADSVVLSARVYTCTVTGALQAFTTRTRYTKKKNAIQLLILTLYLLTFDITLYRHITDIALVLTYF